MDENELAGFLALKHANGMHFKDVLALHAHLLAEQVRAEIPKRDVAARDALWLAAARIDPEVS